MTYKEIIEEADDLRARLDDLDSELVDKLQSDELIADKEVETLLAETGWINEVLRKMERGIEHTKTLLEKMNLL